MTRTPFDPSSSILLQALHQRATDRVPVWFMRQAGRSLPEYRAVRGVESILKVLEQPDLAAEITLQPVRRYGVDAAILYSDIMAPFANLNIGIDIVPGVGPVLDEPLRTHHDLRRLRAVDPSTDLLAMMDTVDLCVKELNVPLIGFCGGPFTVASYLVEGRPSRTHTTIKRLILEEPRLFDQLASRLVDISVSTLAAQVAHGASVVQIFDSWIGTLSPWMFRTALLPHLQRLAIETTALGVPVIYFGVETAGLLDDLAGLGFTALGLDWRTDLNAVVDRLGTNIALQGNLDPSILLAPREVLLTATEDILMASARVKGYIFNLGHGILPETDPDNVAAVVDFVHRRGTELRSRIEP
ncbi:uroporphyrinogen decarboxylase [Ferrimicrobium sp.]|uniref:uroporphyrinogen decarboxylase n=1 Tax=Ferrimicrobium sp. TaxID=2926050 RepID=UPI002615ECB7|nr:uroporphyrinogen decarboxylase [Ferrimicrobium sp.]